MVSYPDKSGQAMRRINLANEMGDLMNEVNNLANDMSDLMNEVNNLANEMSDLMNEVNK
jgi:methyl-accepting chemotaxis protein